jgi:hypothetical protein
VVGGFAHIASPVSTGGGSDVATTGVHPAERAEWQDGVPGRTAGYLEPGT